MKDEYSFSNGSLPDFNEMLRPKLELESDIEFTQEQRNTVYKTMLKPLQVEISQILLYDSKAAEGLLKKYNALLHIGSQQEFYSKYTELTLELDAYKKNYGNQKVLESKGQAIFEQIQDMQKDGKKLSLEDYETEFEKLKQTYDSSISQYSFEDRDKIEKALYNLYGNFMVRRVREGAIDEFEISEQDIPGLTIFLNSEINRLSQNATPQVSNVLERIKYKLMSGKQAFADDEIWKLLSYAQNQNESIKGSSIQQNNSREEKTEELETTALAIANEKKSIFRRIRDYFGTKPKEPGETEEPTLPLKEEDIDKISLEWLVKFVSKWQKENFERERLYKDNNKDNNKDIYLPDPRLIIYDIIQRKYEKFDYKNLMYRDYEEHWHNIYFSIKKSYVIPNLTYWNVVHKPIDLYNSGLYKENTMDTKMKVRNKDFIRGLTFASVLDELCGSKFLNRALNDMGWHIDNRVSILNQTDFIYKLARNRDRILREYHSIENQLLEDDDARRKQFYLGNECPLEKYKVNPTQAGDTQIDTKVGNDRKNANEEQDDGR